MGRRCGFGRQNRPRPPLCQEPQAARRLCAAILPLLSTELPELQSLRSGGAICPGDQYHQAPTSRVGGSRGFFLKNYYSSRPFFLLLVRLVSLATCNYFKGFSKHVYESVNLFLAGGPARPCSGTVHFAEGAEYHPKRRSSGGF